MILETEPTEQRPAVQIGPQPSFRRERPAFPVELSPRLSGPRRGDSFQTPPRRFQHGSRQLREQRGDPGLPVQRERFRLRVSRHRRKIVQLHGPELLQHCVVRRACVKCDKRPVRRLIAAAFEQQQCGKHPARRGVMVRRLREFPCDVRLPRFRRFAEIVTGADDPFFRRLRGGHDLCEVLAQIGVLPMAEEFQSAAS